MNTRKTELVIRGSNQKPILVDVCYNLSSEKQPVILYAHGFNGFKDWGNFDLIAQQFVMAGFTFVKFNFSHNGTSPEHPQDFVDLEAFGQNNYTKQLFDLGQVLSWLCDKHQQLAKFIDVNNIGLIGHSMGGGISIIKTSEDERIKALCTWASIAQCKTPWGSWDENKMKEWASTGLQHYANSRTQQQMPLYYQLYLDYKNNMQRLDILSAAAGITVPFLICHGSDDTSVSIHNAHQLQASNTAAQLFTVASDHVFGLKHPWLGSVLPEAMQAVVDKSISFFKQALL